MGPFVAILAAGLTYIAFKVQYDANIQQRKDLQIERFERNLYEMLHIQQEITNGLLIESIPVESEDTKTSGRNFVQRGRDVFQFVYKDDKFDKNKRESLRTKLERLEGERLDLSGFERLGFLDHYFRHLYRIFKYIDDAGKENGVGGIKLNEQERYEYASIVRATLSQYELVMLFYNGFNRPKFKKLIEKYAILNNLRPELLASAEDRDKYRAMKPEDMNNGGYDYKKTAFDCNVSTNKMQSNG